MTSISHAMTGSAARQSGGWFLLLPAVVWIAAFFILPLGFMFTYSFWQRNTGGIAADFTLTNYQRFFEKSFLYGSLISSLEVALLVVALSVCLAYPLAYILAYVIPPKWRRMALVLAIIPFWTSYVVRSYSWLLVMAENGIVNNTLLALNLISEPIQMVFTRGAVVVGFTHFFIMLLTLTIFASLMQIKPTYRQAAADLGATPFQVFLRVTLPLSMPGVMIGVFLTIVLTIGDYVTPRILGGGRDLLLTEAIMLRIVRQADFPMASAMSFVLMLTITIMYVAFAKWLKLDRL